MAKLFPPRNTVFLGLLLFCGLLFGCSHHKTNRGHLFRCDWAFEYNRTPWVGCPPDSGCEDSGDSGCSDCSNGGGSCLKHKGFRRHCGLTPDCTAKHPCSKTLGCGMWIDPSDPSSFAALNPQNQGIKACGLTPFCSPMKPCGLTPLCGRAVNQPYMNQQALTLGSNGMINGNGASAMNPLLPTPVPGRKQEQPGTNVPGSVPRVTPPGSLPGTQPGKNPVIARPGTPLISMGVVPGVSRVTTGGTVVASGVVTPFGTMTPTGVQLPNGTITNSAVIRACCSNGNCLPSNPCGKVPGCGGLVSIAAVSPTPLNNVMLASAYQTQGVAGQVVQAGGRMINPLTGQPMYGLTMSGYPQTGYPPIGYAPTGYSPGYPQQNTAALAQNAMLLNGQVQTEEETEEEQEESVLPAEETTLPKQQMPAPRFHPIPTKPAFQRSEGLPGIPGTNVPGSLKNSSLNGSKKTAALSRKYFTDEEEEDSQISAPGDTELAYLAGMSAAMDQVEKEIGDRERELEKKQQQVKLVKRAEELQVKIDRQRQEAERLEQEKSEREARLQAQREEQRAIEEQERDAWEEAVQQQLAESKQREERLKKQLQQQQIQMQEQAEIDETFAVQQVPVQETFPVRKKGKALSTAQIQPAYSHQIGAQEVQPVNFAALPQAAPQVASIPVTIPSNSSPLFTPVREAGGLFESALHYLKGSETALPKPRSQPVPQYTAVPQSPQQSTVSSNNSSSKLLQSAKTAGSGLLAAVNGAVSPISDIFGSAQPVPAQSTQPVKPQQTVQRPMPAAKPTQQIAQPAVPVQPPVLRTPRKVSPSAPLMPSVAASPEGGVGFQEKVSAELPKPTKPPTAPKKVKKAVAEDDDAPVIRQVGFFE